MKVAIIGGGISGPAAAMYLRINGHDAVLFERREWHELHSPGILGITPENYESLNSLGAKLPSRPHTNMNYWSRQITVDPMLYVTWTEMHRHLTKRADDMGAEIRFGQTLSGNDAKVFDRIIIASGVSTAAKTMVPNYSGYVVTRGESPIQSGHPWITIPDSAKRWLFNVGDENGRGSFAFYVKRDRPQMRTVYSDFAPVETAQLPKDMQTLVYSANTYQTAPISDWPVPSTIKDGPVFTIGDANGAMRPHTSMGANLGINEARGVARIISGANEKRTIRELLAHRSEMRAKGIQLGKAHLGM
jgi:2-polyprenyl-6-methoxyphenol hydroxylase-like FAD-dependent oxidoreductase